MSAIGDKEDDMNAAEALLGIQGSPAVAAATVPPTVPTIPVLHVPSQPTPTGTSATGFPTTGALSEAPYTQDIHPAVYHNPMRGALGASVASVGGNDTCTSTRVMTMPGLPGAGMPFPPGVAAAAAPQQVTTTAQTRKSGKTKRPTKERKSRRDKFPQKLMEILSNEDYADIISWLPHGRSFLIHSPERFTESILPHYLKECKFSSFTRKLYRWGFRQISKGPDAESFFHKMFRRDKPTLCSMITCGKEIRDGCPELHGGINADSLIRLEQAELRENLMQQRKEAIARQSFAHQTALMNHAEFSHSAAAAHEANVAAFGSHEFPPSTAAALGHAGVAGYTGVGYARYDPLTGLPIGFHPGADLLAVGGGATSGVPLTAAAGMGVAGIGAFASGAIGTPLDDETLPMLAPNAGVVEVQQQLDEMSERMLVLKRRQLQVLHERHQELRRLELQEALRIRQQQAAAASAYAAALTAPPINLTTMTNGVEITNTFQAPGTSLAPQHLIPRSVDVSIPPPVQVTLTTAAVPAPTGTIAAPAAKATSAIDSVKPDSAEEDV